MASVKYPNVTAELIGQDGNAFMLIGLVSRAIRRQVGDSEASAFASKAMDCGSYDELLAMIQRTVVVE